MGWRFRQSFTVVPGLRLNLSSRGLSASIGGAPFTLNVGPDGLRGTASLPGSGLSFHQHLGFEPEVKHPFRTAHPQDQFVPEDIPIEIVRSGSTEKMTSASLAEVRHLINDAQHQYDEITADLSNARLSESEASQRFNSWNNGFLLKHVFKAAFAKRREALETETARVAELEEQLRLSKIAAQIVMESEQSENYSMMSDSFAKTCDCAAIWNIKTHRATDQFHDRTLASRRIEREPIKLSLAKCDLIDWDKPVPALRNSVGSEIFFFPGFILYRAARQAFSLIEYHDLKHEATVTKFFEEGSVPSDTKVVGQTWAKSNKDGSRDRRFADNYQIPIALYGNLELRSATGLWEEFQFSDPEPMFIFVAALDQFRGSFPPNEAS